MESSPRTGPRKISNLRIGPMDARIEYSRTKRRSRGIDEETRRKPRKLYKDKEQNEIGGAITRDKDGYQLRLFDEEAIASLIRLLIAHEEKFAAKQIILQYVDNGGIGMEALRAYQELRRKIDQEVELCEVQARVEWIRRHGKPHSNDPDQTIPHNNLGFPNMEKRTLRDSLR